MGRRIGNHVKIMDGYRHCAVPDPDAGAIPAIGETREGETKDQNGDTSQETCRSRRKCVPRITARVCSGMRENGRAPFFGCADFVCPGRKPKTRSGTDRLPSPAGCPFRNRCEHCSDICAAEKPKLRLLEKDHQVACHLYDGLPEVPEE